MSLSDDTRQPVPAPRSPGGGTEGAGGTGRVGEMSQGGRAGAGRAGRHNAQPDPEIVGSAGRASARRRARLDEVPGHPEDPPGDPDTVARVICLRLLTSQPRTRAELATARTLVRRRVPGTARLEPAARVRRLVGLLARKGYPPAIALRAVREELAASGDADAGGLATEENAGALDTDQEG